MDALQQPHRFMRAPPPPLPSDPQQPRAPPPPPPQAAPWYPNQFHFQPSQPPPPPPPQHSTWASHSEHHQPPPMPPLPSSYPPPHQHNSAPPYPTHPQHHHNPYHPPPLPQQQHMAPPPPPPSHPSYSHPPQSYSQPNTHQAWGNPNWAHHQGWGHQDGIAPNNPENDWAAKARAWAASKAAMENQHQPSQFSHFPRPEEHNHGYRDQYQRDPHFTDIQQPSLPAASHQQFSVSLENPQRLPDNYLHEPSSFSSGPSSYYASDEHVPYTARDGAVAADPSSGFPYQGTNVTNSSVCQQEVSSTYSSVPGKEEVGDRNVYFHTQSPLSSAQDGQGHVQPRFSDSGRPIFSEQRHFTYGDRPAEPIADPSDRPLEFAPGFYREYDSHNQHSQGSYTNPEPAGSVDTMTTMPSVSTLTPPVVPGMVYPSMPPVPSGFDPSFGGPIPGHAAPMFGQIPGPNFRPPVPTVSAPFGLGMGAALHPGAAFPGDTNGISSISDRPKKASVPNWLREEIIKKKSVIASSSQEHPDNPAEDDGVEKSFAKVGVSGSKSMDSSRSSDDEDDDEDDVEAARTAAINQEIKRVLTEVLLKVTDELFDEIAAKVLSEDDMSNEVDNFVSRNHKTSPSPPTAPTPKASAKVLIPVKSKETEADDASGKSSSGLPGDVLGLANYASDDDEDESSSKPTSRQMHAPQPSIKLSEDIPEAVENGGSQAEGRGTSRANLDNNQKRISSNEGLNTAAVLHKRLNDDESDEDLNQEKSSLQTALNENIGVRDNKINADGGRVTDAFNSKDVGGKPLLKPELEQENIGKKSIKDATQAKQHGAKSDKYEERESKRRSADKDDVNQAEAGKAKVDEKHRGSSESRKDERHVRKEKTDERNGLKEKLKDRGSKPGEKARESDSRRSSSSRDDKKESEKIRRSTIKDDSTRKREREKDAKEDRSRHRSDRDSNKHKRRRSPSVGKRVRNSKDNSVSSPVKELSDEASDDSRQRKLHSRKRSLSPSPTRSRRRQVSRSPHSKHSQRRHSPYSSHERTRRRSKSKSPGHRRK